MGFQSHIVPTSRMSWSEGGGSGGSGSLSCDTSDVGRRTGVSLLPDPFLDKMKRSALSNMFLVDKELNCGWYDNSDSPDLRRLQLPPQCCVSSHSDSEGPNLSTNPTKLQAWKRSKPPTWNHNLWGAGWHILARFFARNIFGRNFAARSAACPMAWRDVLTDPICIRWWPLAASPRSSGSPRLRLKGWDRHVKGSFEKEKREISLGRKDILNKKNVLVYRLWFIFDKIDEKIPHQEVPHQDDKLSGNFLHLQGATKAAPTAGGHPPMARPEQLSERISKFPSVAKHYSGHHRSIVPRCILNLLYVLLGSFLELVKSPKPKLCSTSKKFQNIADPWVLRCSEGLYWKHPNGRVPIP